MYERYHTQPGRTFSGRHALWALGRSQVETRGMRSVEIVRLLSGIVVFGFCPFLIGLAVVIATKPSLAERFLRSFASSAPAHYTEQGVRLLVGAAPLLTLLVPCGAPSRL
jgi:hypothetical protein